MTETLRDAERVQVKLFAEGEAPKPLDLIPVFHRWIQDDVVKDELLVDVADYSHVPQGPGVLLVGHGADWYYDQGEGRPGLLFSRKRAFEGDLRARLRDAFRQALEAAKRLQDDPTTGLRFGTSELLVRVPDRLHAPNTDAAFTALAPLVAEVAGELFGGEVKVERADSGRGGPLAARVHVPPGVELDALPTPVEA
ncbi:MAG TPA: hypothetical protein RMH85_11900 [Polyangiaceae bacterium LLY-WYZ-15_(1-7)]|nr:hypothetical protein [Myxococcales bacterium]MAT26986.1 hypothetical protein [Sandaracinus sp.]HJK90661.1 hypothetical protein [Polyangiaceae bacterium LLY-WYZ-15_(1-7)]HJL06594.1 hypothetical protein [Polyangiaceae bacterium LLY-WYZ-15_(1-7)]HJL09200.1 hypothetical protein [Polyangiaceae bacterium LLY-WYZ-15_(1-7)]